MVNFDVELDLSGLNCPIPALEVRKALQDLGVGQVLKAICSDPLTRVDLPVLCHQLGAELVRVETLGALYLYWIRK